MKETIVLSLESVRRKLKITTNAKGQGCCFELFGYDFIVDASFGIWLIEVNTNPCLEESSRLLSSYVPRMINDALRLTIDQVFAPKRGQPTEAISKFPVDNYTNDENMWEFLSQMDPCVQGARIKE